MGTTGKVSVPALRILIYTILAKAVIDMVMLACMTASGADMVYTARTIPEISSVLIIAQTAGFINVVACVMCLGGIAALSEKFVRAQGIMVAVLLIECFIMLPVTAGLYLTITGNAAAASAMNAATLTLAAAERLLTGAAFLFLMKGFGENLRRYEDGVSAASSEKLGRIYFCLSIVSAIGTFFLGSDLGFPMVLTDLIVGLAGVILELLMYIRAKDAAFLIWRKRAFSDQ